MSKLLTEKEVERIQVECVFGLGGGELHIPHPRFPDEWDGSIRYWYEGPPEYYEAELRHLGDEEYRTAIQDCMYGQPDVPVGWKLIAQFRSSGERECWWCRPGTDWDKSEDQAQTPGGTNTGYRGDPKCQLCEGSGYVYLGDGMCELVYRRILCPICGEEIHLDGKTTDGRLIGSCGDAFSQEQWESE